MARIVIYSPYYPSHACAYIRIWAPMRAAGWDVMWAKREGGSEAGADLARGASLVVVQRQYPSLRTEKVLAGLFRLGIPVVYDLDDLLLQVPQSHPSGPELARRAPFIRWTLNEADLVTASTLPLARLLERETARPVRVQPNLVDWSLFDRPPASQEQGVFRFLIAGTSTHARDWAIIEGPLMEVLARHRGRVGAVFFGPAPAALQGSDAVETIGFEDDYRRYAARLNSVAADAALVPLEDTTFNRCKSNIKWLEYAAVGLAGAYTDLAPYAGSVEHMRSGLLVKNTAEGWHEAMQRLLERRGDTRAMAEAARRRAYEEFSLERGAERFVAAYADLFGRRHRRALLGGAATLGARLRARAQRALAESAFINRHVRWRLTRR